MTCHVPRGAGEATKPKRTGVHVRLVDMMLEGLKGRGVDPSAFLLANNFPPGVLRDPSAMISTGDFARLIRKLTKMTGDELWWLGPERIRLGTFQTLCRILITASELSEAIELGIRLLRSITTNFTLRMQHCGEEVRIWLTDDLPRDGARSMLHCTVMFFLYNLSCWLVGRRFPMFDLSFSFGGPHGTDDASRIFGGPVRFNAAVTEMRLDATLLALPVIASKRQLASLLERLPDPLIVRYRDEKSVVLRLSDLFKRNVKSLPSIEQAAVMIGMSPQTVRRRLQEENYSFRALKDKMRYEAALELLHRTEMPLEDMAREVGFAELSSFHRAFKRWMGIAPGSYREQVQGVRQVQLS